MASEHNEVLLTRASLRSILHDLSNRLYASFGHQLKSRRATRDIDYIHRAFVADYQRYGVFDAEARLTSCIAATARKFGLGGDWMNAHADVALPMAPDRYGRLYDPIAHASMNQTNIDHNTIYSSPGLLLVGVTWAWGLALKFVRYQKDDPGDVAAMLRLAYWQRGIKWDVDSLEKWMTAICWPMGYSSYPHPKVETLRKRLHHAIALAKGRALPTP
ncbi:hypothetical protein EWM64_g4338 [Hericium alpestre]|uniref:Uncharacterized protein n=1 Tax=Hericium alpestre TaxID=135208 RepID=A0A4Z0A023_9AGAM|nr:hypothetical protein EWM64_g4338 [Hericium alpestre]